jgi:hypothetical protein
MIGNYRILRKIKSQNYMATIGWNQNKLLPKYQSLDQMRKKEAPSRLARATAIAPANSVRTARMMTSPRFGVISGPSQAS